MEALQCIRPRWWCGHSMSACYKQHHWMCDKLNTKKAAFSYHFDALSVLLVLYKNYEKWSDCSDDGFVFLVPMIHQSKLENVLPSCVYSPTYVVKDFPIARYQGLQFVSNLLSSWHPIFLMQRDKKCFNSFFCLFY